MSGMHVFEIWIIAFFTLALFSFLYKDNPIYRFAEHIFAGLSAGYYVGLIWHTVILQQLWNPILGGRWLLVIPGLLGALMFARFSSKKAWISRTPLAFVMAVTAGIFLISQLHGLVLPQVQDTMLPKTEAVLVDSTAYEEQADRLVITDSLAAPGAPATAGSVTVSKPEVARTGTDSVVISATFRDPAQPPVERVAFTLKLRLPDDKTQKALVVNATTRTPGVTIAAGGGGVYTASYVYRPDSTRAPGPYDISFQAYRVDHEVMLTLLVLLGVITTLIYFYFSKEHTGALGVAARIGIWFIMIGFGAHFGYTVMGRVSLLIGRVQFLLEDWIGTLTSLF